MSDSPIKVTDRRMFTPDGQLKEEFRHLEAPSGRVEAEPPATASSAPKAAAPPAPAPAPGPAKATPSPGPEPLGGPGQVPTLYDLVAMLAEPASIYLDRAQSIDAETSQNLEMARLHIDLLGVLREKTSGNLTMDEQTMLDGALYQLRLAYVEIRGG